MRARDVLCVWLTLGTSVASADALSGLTSCNATGDIASRFVLLMALLALSQRGKRPRR